MKRNDWILVVLFVVLTPLGGITGWHVFDFLGKTEQSMESSSPPQSGQGAPVEKATTPAAIDTVDFRSELKAGDRFTIVESVDFSQTLYDGSRLEYKATTPIHVSVAPGVGDSFLVTWRADKSMLEGVEKAPPAVQAMISKILALSENSRLVFSVDGSGAVRGLHNPEELRRLLSSFLAIVDDAMRRAGMPAHEYRATKALHASLLNSASINELFLFEPRLVHALFGRKLRLHEPLEFDLTTTNWLGGEALPTSARFTLENTTKDGKAIVSFQQSIDEEKSKDIIYQSITRLAAEANMLPTPKSNLRHAVIDETARYVYGLETGRVQSVSYERFSDILNNTTLLKLDFRILPVERQHADATPLR